MGLLPLMPIEEGFGSSGLSTARRITAPFLFTLRAVND
jgi:hypothetical protein